jgi:hypothetical protein
MSKPPKPKYRTTNWSAYNASLPQRGSMRLWIDQDMNWEGAQSGKRGHPPRFSDAAIQFCLMIKNQYGLALRQTTGMLQSLLKLAGLDWEVPDFSTLCRRQKILQVTLTHLRRSAPMHLLVDSPGIKMLGERVMARDFDRQIAELQIRAALLNLFIRLSTPQTILLA